MALSLKELKEYLVSKGGYTITPNHNQLADLKELVTNMMEVRNENPPSTGSGYYSGTTCNEHQNISDFKLSLGDINAIDIKGCSCNTVNNRIAYCRSRTHYCSCNSNTSACSCNNRTATTCDCKSRTHYCSCNSNAPTCACNSRSAATCNCQSRTSTNLGGGIANKCVSRSNAVGLCFCNYDNNCKENYDGNKCRTKSYYNGDYLNFRKEWYCTCNKHMTRPCTCNSRTPDACNCQGRTSSCGSRNTTGCTCNSRTPDACNCQGRTSSCGSRNTTSCSCNSRCACNAEKRFS